MVASKRYEAIVAVVDRGTAILAAREAGLRAASVFGSQWEIELRGSYEAIMSFLTGYLSMTATDADTHVTER